MKARDQKITDDSRLLRAWKNWHAEQLQSALRGPDGAVVAEIMGFLASEMAPGSASRLLGLLRQTDWRLIDIDTRLTLLHEINHASARLRESLKLAPFSDSLPGQPPTLFQLVRQMLDPNSCLEQESTGTQ